MLHSKPKTNGQEDNYERRERGRAKKRSKVMARFKFELDGSDLRNSRD